MVQIERLSIIRQSAPSGSASTEPASHTSSPSGQPLNRLPASLTERMLADGRTEMVLSFEDRDTAVLVRGPDKSLVHTVVGTVQLADLDGAGCPAVSAGRPAWDRADRGDPIAVDIGDANAVSVCAYSSVPDGSPPRLAASAELSGSAAVPLLKALRAAPAGRNSDAAPSTCSSSGPVRSFLVLLARHQDGSVDQVRVHYDGCHDRYVVAATGQSRVSLALLQAAYDPLGIGFGVTGDLV